MQVNSTPERRNLLPPLSLEEVKERKAESSTKVRTRIETSRRDFVRYVFQPFAVVRIDFDFSFVFDLPSVSVAVRLLRD